MMCVEEVDVNVVKNTMLGLQVEDMLEKCVCVCVCYIKIKKTIGSSTSESDGCVRNCSVEKAWPNEH